jgi:hypothetical protein
MSLLAGQVANHFGRKIPEIASAFQMRCPVGVNTPFPFAEPENLFMNAHF